MASIKAFSIACNVESGSKYGANAGAPKNLGLRIYEG
jgi:hypothetical protein